MNAARTLLYYSDFRTVFFGCLYVSFLSKRVGVKSTQSIEFSNSLEVLRGIAAFLVFGAHSTMHFGYANKQVITAAMGEMGVMLFFMLTGHFFGIR